MKTVIQKEDVLEKAIRTRYYFDIQGILDAMQKDGLIKPDGTLYSLFLRSRAEGKDCYQTVCDILEHTESFLSTAPGSRQLFPAWKTWRACRRHPRLIFSSPTTCCT